MADGESPSLSPSQGPVIGAWSLPPSKSEFNRRLLVASYHESFQDLGKSSRKKIVDEDFADDIQKMWSGLRSISKHQEVVDCGEAAAVFRFLALRDSREAGKFRLKGSAGLFSRPHEELEKVLDQLGVNHKWIFENDDKVAFEIESSGSWKLSRDPICVRVDRSSQFASSLILNAWQLPSDLHLQCVGSWSSYPYFEMSLEIARQGGMQMERVSDREFRVAASSRVNQLQLEAEGDWSSAFVLAALGASLGEVRLSNLREHSAQSDSSFVEILKQMGAHVRWEHTAAESQLVVSRASRLASLDVDLSSRPDLFPVLASLCSVATGTSMLRGLQNLKYKESNRLSRICELFDQLQISYVREESSLEIVGNSSPLRNVKNEASLLQGSTSPPIKYDPRPDHRLAMAALLLQKLGFPLDVLHLEVLNKSFPQLKKWIGEMAL